MCNVFLFEILTTLFCGFRNISASLFYFSLTILSVKKQWSHSKFETTGQKLSLCAFPQFLGHAEELFYEMECQPADYSWLGMGPNHQEMQWKKQVCWKCFPKDCQQFVLGLSWSITMLSSVVVCLRRNFSSLQICSLTLAWKAPRSPTDPSQENGQAASNFPLARFYKVFWRHLRSHKQRFSNSLVSQHCNFTGTFWQTPTYL